MSHDCPQSALRGKIGQKFAWPVATYAVRFTLQRREIGSFPAVDAKICIVSGRNVEAVKYLMLPPPLEVLCFRVRFRFLTLGIFCFRFQLRIELVASDSSLFHRNASASTKI